LTEDESWILWHNIHLGSWFDIDKELLERVSQIIAAKKSMLTIFFQPYSFGVINILPQNKTFTTEYFIQHIIAPLHQLHLSASPNNAPRKL
jgi:kynureninase